MGMFVDGKLIKDGKTTSIKMVGMLISDQEQAGTRLKRGECRYYTIPDKVDGVPVLGLEDQHSKGYLSDAFYRFGSEVRFIPLNFFDLRAQKPESMRMPSIVLKGKWRIDFYKKTVLGRVGSYRHVRFDVKGQNWMFKKDETSPLVNLRDIDFFAMDQRATVLKMKSFCGMYQVDKFSAGTQTVKLLDGWIPCLVRQDLEGPFSIEYYEL